MEPCQSLNLEDICSRLSLLPEAVKELARDSRKYYTKFERRKRSGGFRTISASQGRLKWMQRTFLDGMLSKFEMPPHVQGCVKGRSAQSNAKLHEDKDLVINIDLCDFFGSVSLHMVTQLLIDVYSFDEEAAEVFANLTVIDGVLPQGAPTSPTLANIAALKLDADILEICRDAVGDDGFSYSRYVDDITISGGKELEPLLPRILESIDSKGFTPNVKKTRILRRNVRQSVTGLVVNKTATVPTSLIRSLRQQVYYCRRWGLKEHCETLGTTPARFLRNMRSMIGYVGTVRPDLGMEFSVALEMAAQTLESDTDDEHNLKLLKRMIDNDTVASFKYDGEDCVVAPVSLMVDSEGTLVLRAFQLQPIQRWKYFAIADMRKLTTA